MRTIRLMWVFFRVGALNELQYRANFALQVLQSIIALGTGLAVLGLVFSHTSALNGWTPAELLAVLGVHTLMGGIIGTSIQPNMVSTMRRQVRPCRSMAEVQQALVHVEPATQPAMQQQSAPVASSSDASQLGGRCVLSQKKPRPTLPSTKAGRTHL